MNQDKSIHGIKLESVKVLVAFITWDKISKASFNDNNKKGISPFPWWVTVQCMTNTVRTMHHF